MLSCRDCESPCCSNRRSGRAKPTGKPLRPSPLRAPKLFAAETEQPPPGTALRALSGSCGPSPEVSSEPTPQTGKEHVRVRGSPGQQVNLRSWQHPISYLRLRADRYAVAFWHCSSSVPPRLALPHDLVCRADSSWESPLPAPACPQHCADLTAPES